MRRCFDLARLGAMHVAPNPMVGAVLVYQGRVIGEGFHHLYGGPHAEVEAIGSVSVADQHLIPRSTIYVSLEPCCHHGKTPPCTDLIIDSGIRHVVIAMTDPNPEVNGQGVSRLRDAGIQVDGGILTDQAMRQQRMFRTLFQKQRPHVIIKFAQSADRFIGKPDRQVWLSNSYEKIMVHKMRGELDAILVGTNTAVIDNPQLTTREYAGNNPLRVVIDRHERIPPGHYLLDDSTPTLIFSRGLARRAGRHTEYLQLPEDDTSSIDYCLEVLASRKVMSLMVEGGASLIDSFVSRDLWDEAWVVTTRIKLGDGIRAPVLQGRLIQDYQIDQDHLTVIAPNH